MDVAHVLHKCFEIFQGKISLFFSLLIKIEAMLGSQSRLCPWEPFLFSSQLKIYAVLVSKEEHLTKPRYLCSFLAVIMIWTWMAILTLDRFLMRIQPRCFSACDIFFFLNKFDSRLSCIEVNVRINSTQTIKPNKSKNL